MPFTRNTNQSGCSHLFSRLFAFAFGLLFAGIGSFFLYLFGREFWGLLQRIWWEDTECIVVSNEVRGDANGAHTAHVILSYSANAQPYSAEAAIDAGTRYSREGAEAGLQRYPNGSKHRCWFDPAHPQQVALQRNLTQLWGALMLLIPLVFVVTGLLVAGTALIPGGIGIAAIRTKRPPAGESVIHKPARPANAGRIIFLFFFLVGGSVTYAFFVRPALEMAASTHWTPAACRVLASRVLSKRDSDGTTYAPHIEFGYEAAGRHYVSSRYEIFSSYSSSQADSEAIVHRYPAGGEFTCYYDPGRPDQAVIKPGFSSELLMGLLPLSFALFGLIGLLAGLRKPAVRRAIVTAPPRPPAAAA